MLWLPETILNEAEVEMGAGETGLRLIAENKKVNSYCLSPTLPPLPFLMIAFCGPTNEDVAQAQECGDVPQQGQVLQG